MKSFSSTQNRREALSALLTDPCEEVRVAAAEALERLESIGNLPEVLEALKKGDLGTKLKALYALGRIGGEQVIAPLLYCATRPEEDIKSVAIEVLGDLGHPKALPVLLESLKDPNPTIQAKTIAALKNFKDPSLVPAIKPFLDAGDGLRDAEAACTLGHIADGAFETKIMALLRSPHPRTREAAAQALGTLPVT
jgi:HEAT repeat protein